MVKEQIHLCLLALNIRERYFLSPRKPHTWCYCKNGQAGFSNSLIIRCYHIFFIRYSKEWGPNAKMSQQVL